MSKQLRGLDRLHTWWQYNFRKAWGANATDRMWKELKTLFRHAVNDELAELREKNQELSNQVSKCQKHHSNSPSK